MARKRFSLTEHQRKIKLMNFFNKSRIVGKTGGTLWAQKEFFDPKIFRKIEIPFGKLKFIRKVAQCRKP